MARAVQGRCHGNDGALHFMLVGGSAARSGDSEEAWFETDRAEDIQAALNQAWQVVCAWSATLQGWVGHLLLAAMAASTEMRWGMASPLSQSAIGMKIRPRLRSVWRNAGESSFDGHSTT